jgi:hypothetical protein
MVAELFRLAQLPRRSAELIAAQRRKALSFYYLFVSKQRVAAAGALQQFQKPNSISIVSEDLLPLIAPGAEMIDGVFKFNP